MFSYGLTPKDSLNVKKLYFMKISTKDNEENVNKPLNGNNISRFTSHR